MNKKPFASGRMRHTSLAMGWKWLSGGPVIRDHAWRSFFMTYVPLTTITVILILLLSWPATAQNEQKLCRSSPKQRPRRSWCSAFAS